MHSFLLIGQSNMAGRGYLTESRKIDSQRIYTLRNGRWNGMFRPINPDRSTAGVNLGETFAEKYTHTYNVDVGLICCADGGSSLEKWQPGSILFDNAVNNAKLAQRTSEIVGILWHQGESDCDPELYPTYEERFNVIMYALRDQLNLHDVPLIVGGLGDFLKDCTADPMVVNYQHINDTLKRIADKNDLIEFVSAEGLTSNPDNLHFNAASLYEFGLRYFDAYQKFMNCNNIKNDSIPSDTERSAIELL